jgi:Tfp pilus assembly protein PilF
LCNQLGQYDEAIASSRHALSIDPSLIICRRLIATALEDQGRLSHAIDELNTALILSPNDADVRNQLARLRAAASREGRARP